jgi:hypothetical protein
MATNSVKMVIRGKTSYAKILGDPVLNYSKDGKEWKMDLVIDKDTAKEFKDAGIGDRVKSKPDYLDGQFYVTFKRRSSVVTVIRTIRLRSSTFSVTRGTSVLSSATAVT